MLPRIVYMGTPDFAVAPLQALYEAGYPVVCVVTVPDKPAGRGLKLRPSPVKEYAGATRLRARNWRRGCLPKTPEGGLFYPEARIFQPTCLFTTPV